MQEPKAQAILVIQNEAGEVIDRIYTPHKKGIQRVSWDLRQPYVSVANADSKRESLNTFRLNVAPWVK